MTPESQPTLAYILKGYPRISETFISNEILLLEQLGFKMHLFSMRRPRETFCHESVKKIRAAVDYLPTDLLLDLPRLVAPNIISAVRNPRRYQSALGLAARRYRRTRKTATFKHLFQGGYLAQKHLTRNPAIIHLHGHFAHSPTSVTMFASLLSALPFSFSAHAKDIYTSDREQLREKIRKAAFVTTCTRHNKTYLQKIAAGTSTPIHCIYHGIDLLLFDHSPSDSDPEPPYQLLTVARLTEKKGLPTIYRALKILAEQNVDFHHNLIGDGDQHHLVKTLIKELGLAQRCALLGARTHTEVLDYFKTSDLFILGCQIASDGDRDGIPNVLVESLAMGTPAVSTNVSAISEILINGETGMTVAPEDSEKLAAAILRLLKDSALRNKVSSSGKTFVTEHFDNRKLISSLASVFKTIHPQLLPVAQPSSHA